ncbi:MAG: B12-binding domain-containing radical SAM protein [Ruminococcus sp.]|nr:B12-binding domain-containing radical SAM protein [Ruminococcus sp.]
MSSVLFVVPVFKEAIRQECNGTLLLATILKGNGIDTGIYRYYEASQDLGFDSFLDNSVNNILSHNPQIVSFYCRGDSYLANIMVAKKLKAIRPEIHIVFGGPQADITARETIEQIPWVDYCCSGEGETTIYPLFKGLLNGEDVTHINGLTYRSSSNKTITNTRPELIANLDSNPFIDYKFLPKELFEQIKEKPIPISIDIGRGCPYNCAYCSTSLFWQRKFRLKSADRIVEEMKRLYNELGITKFIFDHDLFTASKKRVFEFCNSLKDSELNFKWACSSRADTIDEETIEEMASCGLGAIYLGIETGSARMQKIIHKNLNIEKTIEIIKCIVDNDIKPTISYIYGFPEETYDDVEETLQMVYTLYKYGVSSFQFHLCSIFPGTEYFEKYKNELVWAENFSDQTGNFGVEENIDFIREHKELFPFYYEYHNELRSRLNGMNKRIMLFMELYDYLITVDPEKYSDKRIIDLYLDFIDANEHIFKNDTDMVYSEIKQELYYNYISSAYDEDNAQKFKEILTFKIDLQKIKEEGKDTSDVKIYNIDIDAVIKEKKLKDIRKRTSMVYITVVNNKVSCGVQYLD